MKNIIYHPIAFKLLKIKILNYALIKLVEQITAIVFLVTGSFSILGFPG